MTQVINRNEKESQPMDNFTPRIIVPKWRIRAIWAAMHVICALERIAPARVDAMLWVERLAEWAARGAKIK